MFRVFIGFNIGKPKWNILKTCVLIVYLFTWPCAGLFLYTTVKKIAFPFLASGLSMDASTPSRFTTPRLYRMCFTKFQHLKESKAYYKLPECFNTSKRNVLNTWKDSEWRPEQSEQITLPTTNHSFFLFCMKNSFVSERRHFTISSSWTCFVKFAILKESIVNCLSYLIFQAYYGPLKRFNASKRNVLTELKLISLASASICLSVDVALELTWKYSE